MKESEMAVNVAEQAQPVPLGPTSRLSGMERVRTLGIFASFALMVIIFSILAPEFGTIENVRQVALSSSINAVIAIGMTLVIITAGIDLSVGSIAGLSGIVAAVTLVDTASPGVGILVGLGVGLACGLLNGLLIAGLRLGAFIVTLGTLSLYRGLSLVTTDGTPVYGLPDGFRRFISGFVGPVPVPVIIAAVVAVLAYFMLRSTAFGDSVVAVGGNEEAARLCGIPVMRVKIAVYGIAGLLSGLGGLILIARVGASDPTAGVGYELDAIAAAVIGGASLSGGKGRIFGTLLGALMLGALRNGLTLLDVPTFYQQVASGLVIISAIVIDRFVGNADS
jgi:ribose transport system permease protein